MHQVGDEVVTTQGLVGRVRGHRETAQGLVYELVDEGNGPTRIWEATAADLAANAEMAQTAARAQSMAVDPPDLSATEAPDEFQHE